MKNYIERTLSKIIEPRLFKGKAIIIYGPRQSGKTTLMKHIIENAKMDPLLLNGDDDLDVRLFNTVTMSRWDQILENKKSIFIDEGQRIKNLGKSVKLLIDSRPDIQVLITGSSSFDLASNMEEPLTGRKFEYKLFPLTYKELINHNGFISENKDLETRLIYGSYPEIVTDKENMQENLKMLSNSYLYRDLLQYEGIRKPQLLEKLLKALALQCGNQVSINELSSTLGVSRTLVESYLTLLQQSFIIFSLPSYSTNKRNELKKSKKYYFWDNGIRNAIINDYTPLVNRKDIGVLWENYLVSEKLKANYYSNSGNESYFWRTTDQMEVDYIETNQNSLYAFEFKWNEKKQTRLTKAFSNRYPKSSFQNVTPSNYDEFLS